MPESLSDWIPVPKIENVLIVLANLADDAEALAESPALIFLEAVKNWKGATVYLFHNPPEAGELLEDVAPELAAEFALAAQMSDIRAEVCRDALRRVFSRAVVQRVVLVNADRGDMGVTTLAEAFTVLEGVDVVWAGEWPHQFMLGMRNFHSEIFTDIETAESDLRNCVEAVVEKKLLKFQRLGPT